MHGQKRLNQVLKTAKGFERQKLARRINVVRGDGGVAVDAVKSGGKTTDEIKGVDGGDSKSVEEIADRIARLEREVVVLKVSFIRSEVMFRVESIGVESGWKVMREGGLRREIYEEQF